MLNPEYTEFINYILKLNNITEDNESLQLIIQTILEDIDNGNTCSSAHSISLKLDISTTKVLTLLKKSNLLEVSRDIASIKFSHLFIALDLTDNCLIYMNRYLGFELIIATTIKKLINTSSYNTNYTKEIKDRLTILNSTGNPNDEQLAAIKNAISNQFSIITGGPGTGKTSTVMLVLWALYEAYQCHLNIKICAPTGKASKRVQESMQSNQLPLNNPYLNELINDSKSFQTIHSLLGARLNTNVYQYNPSNQLELDVLIIDESSMLGVSLFSRLLNALDLSKVRHIILLGDKNQLSSVEEGAVFSSLVDALSVDRIDLFSNISNQTVNYLQISNRNSSSVSKFANYILDNNINGVINSFNDDIKLLECDLDVILKFTLDKLYEYLTQLNSLIVDNQFDIKQILSCYSQHMLLCANNISQYGTINLNKLLDQKIQLTKHINNMWYHGKPVIVTENNRTLDLHNGDIGICLELDGIIKVYFENGQSVLPINLPKHNIAYAITIHKSQGSEYQHTSIVLPPASEMVSRELVYTAITRARQRVTIFSNQETIKKAISNKTNRQSGLKQLLKLV